MIKKICFMVFTIISVLNLYGGGVVEEKGNIVTEEHSLDTFNSVRAAYGFQVHIEEAGEQRVIIQVDENVRPHLAVHLDGNTLVLTLEQGYTYRTRELSAEIMLPDLEGVFLSGNSSAEIDEGYAIEGTFTAKASGSSRISFEGLECGDFSVDLSGSSLLSGTINVQDTAHFELSGSSKINRLKGTTNQLVLEQSGGGNADLSDFHAVTAVIDMSGGASARVAVTDHISVDASGGATLNYLGTGSFNPKIDQDLSGAASVNSY